MALMGWQADVICVVYAVGDARSFERVAEYWLPCIRRALNSDGETNAVPVVLVGNKVLHHRGVQFALLCADRRMWRAERRTGRGCTAW